MTGDPDNDGKPGQLFRENSRLFTILGVFGAVSVYFTRLEGQSPWTRLGVVSSLSIFLLVAYAILWNIPGEDEYSLDYIVRKITSRIGLAIFYVSFWSLIAATAGIVVQYSNALNFLLFFLFIVGGLRLGQSFAKLWIPEKYQEFRIQGDIDDPVYGLSLWLRAGLVNILIGGGILLLLYMNGLLPIGDFLQVRSPNLETAPLVGFPLGIGTIGLIFASIAIMGILVIRGWGYIEKNMEILEDHHDFELENEE